MAGLWRTIEQHLPGAHKRARRNGWTSDHIRISRESGINLEGVKLTPEVKNKADETMKRLGF